MFRWLLNNNDATLFRFQYWMLSKDGEIRRDESCIDYAGANVMIFPCHGMKGNQEWRYNHKVSCFTLCPNHLSLLLFFSLLIYFYLLHENYLLIMLTKCSLLRKYFIDKEVLKNSLKTSKGFIRFVAFFY